jgi:hypothetical protein
MNYYLLKIITLVCLFYLPLVNATGSLPSILDYYPNCSYNIIEKSAVKIKAEQPLSEKLRLSLLAKLRNKAKIINADAIIIINKDVHEINDMSSAHAKKYIVSYKAEFIEDCQTHGKNNQQLTPYDHHGKKIQKTFAIHTKIERKFVFTPPNKPKLNHPIITNTELSLEKGIYGINIGTSYQQVIDKFGEPSIILSMSTSELVTGYGRNHWLHFQNGKLVKVQSKLSIVSPVLLNKVPLRDFFDEVPWVIATKINQKSSLSEVKSAMMMDLKLDDQKEVVIKGHENSLILTFSYKLNEFNEKNYYLDGFSLESNNYSEAKFQGEDQRRAQFSILGSLISNLNQGNSIDVELLKSELGQPLGRITVSPKFYIDIYNLNLLVGVKKSELVSIQIREELFRIKDDLAIMTPWSLGDFVQGKSIEELHNFFPADIFELDNKFQIDTEEYQLTLLFDDSAESMMLYEAEVVIY